MKIYEFKYHLGETDWVLAPSIKEAEEFYLNSTGRDDLLGYKITEIHRNRWDEIYIIDYTETEPDDEENYNEEDYCCGFKIIETFAERVERSKYTDIIATTEY